MANGFYALSKQNYDFSGIAADDVRCVLCLIGGPNYVVNLAADEFLTSIAGGDRVAVSASMAGVTWVGGLYDCNAFSFGVVAAGPPAGALVWYSHTGVDATSRLLWYIDGSGGTWAGFPVTPDGVLPVTVTPPAGGLVQL